MVSRITVLMLRRNDVEIVDTFGRVEAWLVKNGELHTLLISCPLGARESLMEFIAECKGIDATVLDSI